MSAHQLDRQESAYVPFCYKNGKSAVLKPANEVAMKLVGFNSIFFVIYRTQFKTFYFVMFV